MFRFITNLLGPIPYITNNLDVSTAHISPQDAELLDRAAETSDPIIVHKYDEGYFIYLSVEEENLQDFSEEFRNILKWARSFDCTYVHLDSDGSTYKHLKTFEW